MKLKKNNGNFSGSMRARLSFDEGFRENPIYNIKANITEKDKGLKMLELVEQNFNISKKDREEFFQNKLKEFTADAMLPTKMPKEISKNQIKFTRDEKGNIVSPFRSNRKINS